MIITGEQALKLRTKLNINQTVFWGQLGVTQSGGCRYESGRRIPTAVQRLYWLTYIVGLLDHLPNKDAKIYPKIGR